MCDAVSPSPCGRTTRPPYSRKQSLVRDQLFATYRRSGDTSGRARLYSALFPAEPRIEVPASVLTTTIQPTVKECTLCIAMCWEKKYPRAAFERCRMRRKIGGN